MSDKLQVIDGSLLEGGGQILRLALSLSALTKTPIKVINIRAGRGKPGLMEQHLRGVQLVASMCGGRLDGDSLGSTEIQLWPQKIQGGHHRADIKTAGATTLLLQTALPCALFADINSTLQLKGGTNTFMAPQIDYTIDIFAKLLKLFGVNELDIKLIKRGFFPKGGGHVEVNVKPVIVLKPVEILDFGDAKRVKFYGSCNVVGVPEEVGQLVDETVFNSLNKLGYISDWDDWGEGDFAKVVNTHKVKANEGIGQSFCTIITGVTTTGYHFGGSSIGKKSDDPVKLATQAVDEIIKTVKEQACLDQYGQDQIIIFMALADGVSQIRVGEVTMHTKTAIYICELLTKAKFTIASLDNGSIIKCEGIGFRI